MALKEKRSEAVVGVFLLIGLAALATLLIKYGGIGTDGLDESYTVDVTFDNAAGLIKGSEVRMGGARIGKVIDDPTVQEDLTVKLKVRLTNRIKIDKASLVQVESLSFIGDKMIIISKPKVNSGEVYQEGDRIVGDPPGGLDAIQGDAQKIIKDVAEIVNEAKGTMSQVNGTVNDISVLITQLTQTINTINSGVLDESNLASIKASVKNIEELTAGFKTMGNDFQPTVAEVNGTVKDLRATINEMRGSIAGINDAIASAEKTFNTASTQLNHIEPALKDVPETLKSFQKAADKATATMDLAQESIAKVTEGDGLLNTLSDDKEFDTDTKQFVKNLKHYGILRYKDDATSDPKNPEKNRYRSKSRR